MAETLVVGVGNDLRRDDAVGRRVAEAIEALDLPGVVVRSVSQLVPELAELMVALQRVVFVDATLSGERVMARRIEAADGRGAMTHHGDPAVVLAYAGLLRGQPPEAYVVSIPVEDLGLGEGLTRRARRGLERATELIRDLVVGGQPEHFEGSGLP